MANKEALSSVQLVAFDFDGVFTDNTVYVSQDGIESVRCWRSDGLGLARLNNLGVHLVIISTERNPVVTARAKKLNIRCMQGIEDKAATIRDISNDIGVALGNVMFVGNDVNDIPALKSVGWPVAVADAHPDVLPHIRMQTRRAGGYGAVREVCDLIFQARSGPPPNGLQ